MEIHEIMKKERTKSGYTQKEIAEKIGITQQQYGLYETGRRELPISKVTDFCRACHISPNELFEWVEN